METNDAERAKLMQKVNLIAGDPKQCFAFSELESKVADFDASLSSRLFDGIQSHVRRTGVGYNKAHKVVTCEQSARIIAVHDPIGNLADISCLHEHIYGTDLMLRQKYAYAITTARAVENIKPHLEKNPNWLKQLAGNDYPIDENLLAEQTKYATKKDLFEKGEIIEKLLKAHKTMLYEKGNYTLTQQLETIQLAFARSQDFYKKIAIIEYAASLLNGGLQSIDISPTGALAQGQIINKKKDNPYGKYFEWLLKSTSATLGTFSEVGHQVAFSRLHFDAAITRVVGVTAYAKGLTFPPEEVFDLGDTLWRSYRIKTQAFSGSFDAVSQGLMNQTQSFVDGYLHQVPPNDLHVFDDQLIDHHTKIELEYGQQYRVYLTMPDTQPEVAALQQKLNISKNVGKYVAGSMLVLNLLRWDSQKKGLEHPGLLLAYDALGLVAASHHNAQSVYRMGAEAMQNTNESMLKKLFPNEKVTYGQAFEGAYQGSAKLNTILINVGRSANILGIAIAAGQYLDGKKRGDEAAQRAAIAAGLSEISFFTATFLTSLSTPLVLLAIAFLVASVVYSMLVYNDYESWVATGFWGNDEDYWGRNREKEFPYQKRLADSFVLASPDSPEYKRIKGFFNDEMNAYYDLVCGIAIENPVPGSGKVILSCPVFTGKDSVEKLTVDVYKQGAMHYRYGWNEKRRWEIGDISKISKTWKGNGRIELDLSAILPEKVNYNRLYSKKANIHEGELLVLAVTHPNFSGDGKLNGKKNYTAIKEV